MGMIYIDYGMVGSRDPEWIQEWINVLIGLFRSVRLMANVEKYNTTTCQLRKIHTGVSDEAFSWKSKGEGFTYQECLQLHTPFPDCGVDITAGYMTDHHRRLHCMDPEIDWNQLPVIQTEYLPQVYEVCFLTNMHLCQCPFPGCPRTSRSSTDLQNHFSILHLGVQYPNTIRTPNDIPTFWELWATSSTMDNEQPPLQHRSVPSVTVTLNTAIDIVAVLQIKSGGYQG